MNRDSHFTFDVFLSYSKKDVTVVHALAERLRADGVRVWLDEWEIKPGDNIPSKIEAGLENSHVLVFCISKNAFGSDWATLESQTFRFRDPLNKERRLIPLRLDDAEINGTLAQFSHVNWQPHKKEYEKLLEAIRPTIDSEETQNKFTNRKTIAASGIENSSLWPFNLIDSHEIEKARAHRKEKFLFEAPEWHHVVHGTDSKVKFVERDQTNDLRQQVREVLIQPLQRGTSNLPVLFVLGSPGAGKSTLVRRVAATLIESDEIVVADAGLNLAGGPADVQSYGRALHEATRIDLPVLLVLDDPLFQDSGWIDLLIYLKQPGFRVAVLAASPDYLYQQYKSQLAKLARSEFWVASPSVKEKSAVAAIYGRDAAALATDSDDFLVMVAEAAFGERFSVIMQRLWQTLNKGQAIDGNLAFQELAWEVRAFWFVCFIHRSYTPCPLPILKKALELSGGTGQTIHVEVALSKIKDQAGWSIFRYSEPKKLSKTVKNLNRKSISTAHQKIASEAWLQRPLSWFDAQVCQIIAQSTLIEPDSVGSITAAAMRLANAKLEASDTLAKELVACWKEAVSAEQSVTTKDLCRIVNVLISNDGRELVAPLRDALQERAKERDGWLAALNLWLLSSEKASTRSFPDSVDIIELIGMADFSYDATLALQLFQTFKNQSLVIDAVYQRLLQGLQADTDWEINSFLLHWFLSHAPKELCARNLPLLVRWLENHDENSEVRTQYLSFLQSLPKEFDEERKQAVKNTAKWLKKHHENSEVRTQYLSFLQSLPKEFDEERKQAVKNTAKWLADPLRDADYKTRTKYLSFLRSLPKEFDAERKQAVEDTAKWLENHDENSDVRAQYLAYLQSLPKEFDEERKQAVEDTAKWLEKHHENSEVRTQYLSFLQSLPKEFDEERKQAVKDTTQWLKNHDENSEVRARYLAYLQSLPKEFDEERKQAVKDTAKWLADPLRDADYKTRTKYLSFLQSLPKEFDEERKQAVEDTAKWLEKHDEDSYVRAQYLSFLQSLGKEFDKERKYALYDTAKWLEKHDENSNVRTQYLTFLLGLPPEFDEERDKAAQETAAWLERHENDSTVRSRYVTYLLAFNSENLDDLYLPSEKHHLWLIAKNPKYWQHRLAYASRLLRFYRFEDAIEQLDMVLERHQGHVWARQELAIALRLLGDMEAAESEFKIALKWAKINNEERITIYLALGELYLETAQWNEAIQAFTNAQKENPIHFGCHWGIAKALIKMGKATQAEESLQAALADPDTTPLAKAEIIQSLNTLKDKT